MFSINLDKQIKWFQIASRKMKIIPKKYPSPLQQKFLETEQLSFISSVQDYLKSQVKQNSICQGFLLARNRHVCECVQWSLQQCPTLCSPMDCGPPGSSVHRDSPGKNTGVSCHSILQGIFLTQGLNLHLFFFIFFGLNFIYLFFIYFYQLEANYFTVSQWLLSYIDMNQPWIYMHSPSRSPLPPPSLPDPSGSSQCTRPEHLSHASNLGW